MVLKNSPIIIENLFTLMVYCLITWRKCMKKYFDIWQNKQRQYLYDALLGFDEFKTTMHDDLNYEYINTVQAENRQEAIDHNYGIIISKYKHLICLDVSWIEDKNDLQSIKKTWLLAARKEISSLGLHQALSLFKHFSKETNNFTLSETLEVNSLLFGLTSGDLSKIDEFNIAIHRKMAPPPPDEHWSIQVGDALWKSIMNNENAEMGDHFYNILNIVKPKNKRIVFNLLNNFSLLLENFYTHTCFSDEINLLYSEEAKEQYYDAIQKIQTYISPKNHAISLVEFDKIRKIKESRTAIVI